MFKSVRKFLRLRILVTCYALVFVGSAACGSITIKTVLSIFVIAAWYLHAASSNDYADRYIDVINLKNAKDRPLVSKDISYRQLWMVHGAAGIMALIFASFYGVIAVLAMVGMLITNYLYSFKPARLSDRGIVSQFVLGVGYVFYPFSLGYWSTSMNRGYAWFLSFGIYLGFVGRLLLKDFRDVKGDKQHGKMTFLLRHGTKTTCLLSGIFWLLSLIFTMTAMDFNLGVTIILILGFAEGTILLSALSRALDTGLQVNIIALIARTANISIISVLAFLLCQQQTGLSSYTEQIIPLVIGLTLLSLNYTRHKTLAASWARL